MKTQVGRTQNGATDMFVSPNGIAPSQVRASRAIDLPDKGARDAVLLCSAPYQPTLVTAHMTDR